MLSFVETHVGGNHFGDVIRGKGRLPSPPEMTSTETNNETGSGLVVSLSGPPGVGKTLTAESGMFPRANCKVYFTFVKKLTTPKLPRFSKCPCTYSTSAKWPTSSRTTALAGPSPRIDKAASGSPCQMHSPRQRDGRPSCSLMSAISTSSRGESPPLCATES